jgi:hypothetical protein
MTLHLWFSRWGQGDADFVWDYWTDFIPYLAIALTSAGRVFGLDRLIAARYPMLRRWPLT